MWGFPPISCLPKWLRISRSRTRCTPCFQKKFRSKCGPFPSGIFCFWAKPPRKGCRISESIPSASLPGKRNPPSNLCLGKRQDISFTSMPEESTIPRCLPRQKRARASAWRKPSMTTLFPWNRCFPFFWSSATLLLPACGGKGRNAAVFPSPSVPWTSRTVPIRPAFPVPRT